ncbi:MAG: hypothetical protein GDA56_26335 [Hormoscilla sp. GM7CHS1pb]|nr:hypothetical protein [Hormoscilla sp. GM7CHS1pb]
MFIGTTEAAALLSISASSSQAAIQARSHSGGEVSGVVRLALSGDIETEKPVVSVKRGTQNLAKGHEAEIRRVSWEHYSYYPGDTARTIDRQSLTVAAEGSRSVRRCGLRPWQRRPFTSKRRPGDYRRPLGVRAWIEELPKGYGSINSFDRAVGFPLGTNRIKVSNQSDLTDFTPQETGEQNLT